MGNLVTNRINFDLSGKPCLEDELREICARISPQDPAQLVAGIFAGGRVPTSLDFRIASPEPEDIRGMKIDKDFDVGLAIVSRDRDYIALWDEAMDAGVAAMPPHMQRTRHSVLAAAGLAGLSEAELLAYGVSALPDAFMAAARSARFFEKTGAFEPITWRTQRWGVRAHSPEATLWLEGDALSMRFDTVNGAPAQWLEVLAEALPRTVFAGASYDQDTDYSASFATEGDGELSFAESDDPDGVLAARSIVSGLSAEDLLAEDEALDGGDADDGGPDDGP
ncbi:hypothetical protein GE300_14795 [Rhodobacteraceae bacterium 2CG4]|uniref:Uncharacterized protein n=1 Tax=Halovulum marinum TaxID=2662447 RepID=A0A6L5Z3J4_9RHOB|nr:hypothetical protein [Halovulum marinum]MSU90869.1 hypothetical protein [Halovulum marinum]